MWLYPGLLTRVHMVRVKWEEILKCELLWQPTVLWPCACPWVEMWPWSCHGGCVALWCLQWATHTISLLSASQGQSHHLHWGLAGGQAPRGAAQEPTPALASAPSREMPQGRTGSPPLLPFISHPSLFVPLCFNFFNCWTCCWTLGYHNSVFFKCKNSQCCWFGDSEIFLHKRAFSHKKNFTCVSPGATANPVWEYTFSYVQSLKNKPLSSSLFFSFPILLPLGLGFVPLSVCTQEVLGIQVHSEGLDYCFPLSSVAVVPHENSCGAGW